MEGDGLCEEMGSARQPTLAHDSGDGGPRAKRQRVVELEQRIQSKDGAAAVPVATISALPKDLWRRILTRLPLKDAIRTSALSQGWRDLWKNRWAHSNSCLDIHLLHDDIPSKVLDSLESSPRHRLDRFSIVVENEKLRPPHLSRFLAYAAECRVEVLNVELQHCKLDSSLTFPFPLSIPRVVHLSLRGISIDNIGYKRIQPFHALEVINLDSVQICQPAFRMLMALCPRLHTLDLRRCDCSDLPYGAKAFLHPAGLNLRSITIVECDGAARLDAVVVPGLRSFRYSGKFLTSAFWLPKHTELTKLYICVDKPIPSVFSDYFKKALPNNLTHLTVLTICSNALEIVSTLLRDGGEAARFSNMGNLQSLRELQLLMFGMGNNNLADIFVFLKASHCHKLERLFVQLPADSDIPLEDLLEEAREQLSEDLCELRMVKVVNFNWRCFEVQLVSSLLRKASFLHKLLLVSPNVAPLIVPGVQEVDLVLLKKALDNGNMIVSESDDATTQALHSEILT